MKIKSIKIDGVEQMTGEVDSEVFCLQNKMMISMYKDHLFGDVAGIYTHHTGAATLKVKAGQKFEIQF